MLPERLNQAKTFLSSRFSILKTSRSTYIVIIILAILILIVLKRSWFVAASVNGAPITNLELQNALNQQHRGKVLTRLVTERIISDEARKQGVVVKNSDIDERYNSMAETFGGADVLQSMLAQDGQTVDIFKNQIKLQLMVEKMYEQEATVSAVEIQDFIAQNESQLQSTESAQQVKEVESVLKQQKISQIFNERFVDLKAAAQIKIF